MAVLAAGLLGCPGREPLQQVFRDLPFTADALQSPVALLKALVGAEIRVGGSSTVAGRVLGVSAEEVTLPNGLGRTTRHRVSVVVPKEGMRQFVLEDADRIELADPRLQAEVTEALAAIVQAWRPSLFAGFMGALASQFWFLAFALATAASVRTLALVEVLFAQAISAFVFGQKTSAREMIGIVMIVAGVALLIWAHG